MITIKQLPPRVSDYLSSYFATLENIRLANRYKLNGAQLGDLALSIGEVYIKVVEIKDIPKVIKDRLKIKEADSFLLAADIVEKHLKKHLEFLGPCLGYMNQWRKWGREFGGVLRDPKGSPEIEKLIAHAQSQAVKSKGPGLDIAERTRRVAKPKKQPVFAKQTVNAAPIAKSVKPTVGDVIKARQEKEIAQEKVDPEKARQKFMEQIKNLSINNLRPPGESASQKLNQMAERITTVAQSDPADKQAINQSLRASNLFALYQEQGQQAIRTRQAMDQVVYQRYQEQKPYLLQDEFEAIGRLIKEVQ